MKYHPFLLAVPLLIAGCTSQDDAATSTGETASTVPVVQATAAPVGGSVPETPIQNLPFKPIPARSETAPSASTPDADLKTSIVGIWQVANFDFLLAYRFFPDGRYDTIFQRNPTQTGIIHMGTYEVKGPQTLEMTATATAISKTNATPTFENQNGPKRTESHTMRIQGNSLFEFVTVSNSWQELHRLDAK